MLPDDIWYEEVVHFKYDLNINQNITYNSDLYFHETVTLCNELPSFFKQYTNISFTEILKKNYLSINSCLLFPTYEMDIGYITSLVYSK